MYNTVYYGDCEEVLLQLRDREIYAQMCVTSPPYWGQRDYGIDNECGKEETIGQYVLKLTRVFRNLREILKDDGTLWLNIGDKYADKNMGTIKKGDLCLIPSRVAKSLRDDGWYLRQEIIWAKTNCMPESVQNRCTRSFEYLFMFAKNYNYYYDYKAIMEPCLESSIKKAEKYYEKYVSGKFMQRKDSCNLGRNNINSGRSLKTTIESMKIGKNKRNVWNITSYNRPYNGEHVAMYPPKLIEPCILAGSKENDVIIDPFIGSGTTAVVAKQLNRRYIGIELNENYSKIIDNRILEGK